MGEDVWIKIEEPEYKNGLPRLSKEPGWNFMKMSV
jgi:hypothetical protein